MPAKVGGVRRLILVSSVALAAIVAGCANDSGDPDGTGAAPATSAADPVAVVRQAMDRSLSSTVTIDASVKVGSQSLELTGKTDPATRMMLVSGNLPEPMEARLIKDTAYLKMSALKGEKPWLKIDLTRLRPNSGLRQSFNLEAQTGIIGGVVTAEEVGDGRYRGTADLQKAAEAASTDGGMREGLESSAKLAKDPRNIPFEATVDAEGRLTALSYTIATKNLGDTVTDIKMSGFGEPVKVTAPPAGQTEEATEEMYRVL